MTDRICPYCAYSLDLAGHEQCRREAEREDYDPEDDR